MFKQLARHFNGIAGSILGFAMLLLTHRYWGIDHDATLYMGEALHLLLPDIYGKDLYFAYGSQGSYTLFPWLLVQLMEWIDPATLFLWGGMAGLLAFTAASWFCLSSMLPAGQRYWVWLGVLCLPTFYGRTVIFSYAEPFLTPRPFAEALSLVAVGLVARKQLAAAAGCLLLAGVLHPLQTLAAALVLWPWLVMQDRRWLHALWLVLPALGAAATGLAPFDGLLRPMEPGWEAELRAITGQLFVTGWPQLDYQYLAFDAAVLAYVWHCRRTGIGQVCLAALAGLTLGFGSSLVLVDVLHLTLPTGLQLWRVHWLAHWLAMAGLVLCLHADLIRQERARTLLLILTGLLAWGTIAWAWVPFGLLYAAWPRIAPRLQPRIKLLMSIVISLAILLLLLQHLAMEWIPFKLSHYQLESFAIDRRILAYPLIALGLPSAATYAWLHGSPRARGLLFALCLVPLIVVSGLRWNIQIPQSRAVLQQAGNPDLFGTTLARHAQVYWHDMSLVASWLALGRADYYDPQQLSGIAFNPGTIPEARRRLGRIGPLLDALNACKQANISGSYSECRLHDKVLRQACAPGATPRPDHLILPFQLSFPPDGKWHEMNAKQTTLVADWSLYSCETILRKTPATSSAASTTAPDEA